MYRIRKNWNDSKGQLGAFSSLDNAKKLVDKNPGFFVFNDNRIAVYPIPYQVIVNKNTTIKDGYSTKAKTVGTAKPGIYTITAVNNKLGKLKSGAGWIAIDAFSIQSCPKEAAKEDKKEPVVKVETPKVEVKKINYLELSAKYMKEVYDTVVKLACSHGGSALNFSEMKSQKKTTCSRTVSFVLQLAGILKDKKTVSHTAAIGGNAKNILTKKNTIAKAMNGYNNLDLKKCDCVYVGVEKFADLPEKYKVAGAAYVQDSNMFMHAGKINNKLTNRSCNNSHGSQVKEDSKGVWRYHNNTVTGGYTFNSPILVVILPKKEA